MGVAGGLESGVEIARIVVDRRARGGQHRGQVAAAAEPVFGGHNHAGENVTVSGEYSEDGEYHQISLNDKGRQVFELLSNYQDYPNGGDGWFQLIDLDPEAGLISVKTWSPFLNKYQTDAMSQFQWDVDLKARWK